MKEQDRLDLLLKKLRWLRLPGIAEGLPQLLEHAAHKNLTPLEIIDRLCDEETVTARIGVWG